MPHHTTDANFSSSKVNAEAAIIIVQLKTRISLYSEYVVLTKPLQFPVQKFNANINKKNENKYTSTENGASHA